MSDSRKIILASASPRRRALLEGIGLADFTILPSDADEELPENISPGEAVKLLAKTKAESVSKSAGGNAVVIAADTVVCYQDEILGKPADRGDAFRMLSMLSGKTHAVYTGFCVRNGSREILASERTEVEFRSLTSEEIWSYIDTGEPFDKAGAYGIQGLGAMLVRRIDGDYYNVMGLPVCRLSLALKEFGINLL